MCQPISWGRRHRTGAGISSPRWLASGLTLIELMIALVLGLLIVIALSAVFVSSSSSRREVELSADVIENGRYAVDLLSRELMQTGFYGTLSTPTGTTNSPCSTTVGDWADSLENHIVAFNSGPAASVADPACLARKAGTDAVFIQRASTCFVGETDASGTSVCDAENVKNVYLQVSECNTEYPTTPSVVAVGNSTTLNLQTKACDGTKAVKRQLIRRFFFIDTNDVLSSVDVTLDGAQSAVPLVENIEQMQIEYGIDSNADGTIDAYTSAPTAAELPQVLGIRIWLLARSTDPSKNTSGEMKFNMGDFQGIDAVTFAAAERAPKRRVYNTYISFTSPKARVEK